MNNSRESAYRSFLKQLAVAGATTALIGSGLKAERNHLAGTEEDKPNTHNMLVFRRKDDLFVPPADV